MPVSPYGTQQFALQTQFNIDKFSTATDLGKAACP